MCAELSAQKKGQLIMEHNGDYALNLSKFDEPVRQLRLLGALNDIAEKQKPGQNNVLHVKTIPNDKALSRMLRAELYPSISCTEHVAMAWPFHA